MHPLAHIASRDWRPVAKADRPPQAAVFTFVNIAPCLGGGVGQPSGCAGSFARYANLHRCPP